jgi:vacuolar-type H+-ATPase subunit I/STV1
MFESKCISIKRKELLVVKRSIFRITRGNCWVNEIEISIDDINRFFTSNKHRKVAAEALQDQVVCLIVFPKGERAMIVSKIDRLLAVMNCHVMNQDRKNVEEELNRKEQKISDIEAMEDLTFEGIRKYISRLAEVREGSAGSWLCELELYVKKEREIYRGLSTTQVTKTLARFRLYIPSK